MGEFILLIIKIGQPSGKIQEHKGKSIHCYTLELCYNSLFFVFQLSVFDELQAEK